MVRATWPAVSGLALLAAFTLGGWLACTGNSSSGGTGGTGGGAGGSPQKGGSVTGPVGTGGIPAGVHIIDVALQCPDFTACGGDLVGTWQLQSACGYDATLHPPKACTGISASSQPTDASTIVFTANKMFTSHEESLSTIWVSFNDDCARAVAGVTAQQSCAGDGWMGSPLECTYANSICTCITGRSLVPLGQTDPYTVKDGQLDIQGVKQDFCVQGDTLTLRGTFGAGGMGGGVVMGQVMKRQP